MEDNTYKKTKSSIKRIIQYIYKISLTPIASTIVNTRIGYRNYEMRMERMDEVSSFRNINVIIKS